MTKDAKTDPAADEADPDVIELVANERGYAGARLIEAGGTFRWRTKGADGKPRKMPKWARKPSDPPPNKRGPWNGDLRPADTQAASKKKTADVKAAA